MQLPRVNIDACPFILPNCIRLGMLLFCVLYSTSSGAAHGEPPPPGTPIILWPGLTFGLAFILYGITRFLIEAVRDDNPFEYAWWAIYKGGTVSQNLGIYLIVLGVIFMAIFRRMKPEAIEQ